MHFSISFLNEFVDALLQLDRDYKAAVSDFEEITQKIDGYVKTTSDNALRTVSGEGIKIHKDNGSAVTALRTENDDATENFISRHAADIDLISACRRALGMVRSAEASVRNVTEYNKYHQNKPSQLSFSAESFLEKPGEIISIAYEVDEALKGVHTSEKKSACRKLYSYCRRAESVLTEHMARARKRIFDDKPVLMNELSALSDKGKARFSGMTSSVDEYFSKSSESLDGTFTQLKGYAKDKRAAVAAGLEARKESLKAEFLARFPFRELAQEFDEIYSDEPNYDEYACTDNIPRSIRIGDLEQDLSDSGLSDFAVSILERYYSFMYRGKKLLVPHSAQFDGDLNYIFRYGGNATELIRDLASGIALRLFMMMQLGKLNFTFYDPVALGGSFSLFSGLVDMDTRSGELINGQIWTTSEDLESKLRTLTEHISGITQRCLRGEFDNIYEYNKDAGYNAEAYQVVMIMDYPAGLSPEAIKLLEQVAQSGPKCGVFVIVFSSAVQRTQLEGSIVNLADSIETYLTPMQYDTERSEFRCVLQDNSKRFVWRPAVAPDEKQTDVISDILRESIKNMDRVVIGTDRIRNAERSDSTLKGIRVPIGIHGANSVQYLTLGSGGCHHVLVAGVAGMGKSSLLHTIVMHSLQQYSPEELEIYLVDFKRGVEFKIYADHRIPQFRVVAIESEREFGYNVLKAIDREQKIRADMFKNAKGAAHVEKIEQYRKDGSKMPRILVIMDEFHELFTEDDEISRQSAILMERIVRQGRAFGVHMILSSQSYANVKGLDKAVYDQMSVRIVLKCSSDDANMLLENGAGMVDLISIEDAGKAVYNSDGGSKEASSMFRSVYIAPEEHVQLLRECAGKYTAFPADKTRILLSSIEDNAFCRFNRFADPDFDASKTLAMQIGEPLTIDSRMDMELKRVNSANMLMVGDNTDKARNMFIFTMISLCVDHWLKHGGKAPEKPFIHLMNLKPLNDSYFVDIPKMLADELPAYIDNVNCAGGEDINELLADLYSSCNAPCSNDEYLLVFGYQRGEKLKSDSMISCAGTEISCADAFVHVLDKGPANGIHTVMWQDKFRGDITEDSMLSRFDLRIAFEMTADNLLSFIMEDNADSVDENTAVYYNALYDNQRFRVYQSPNLDWVKELCDRLKGKAD